MSFVKAAIACVCGSGGLRHDLELLLSSHVCFAPIKLPQKCVHVVFRYNNQPEPELEGTSVTLKADDAAIADMQQRASQAFPDELAGLLKVLSRL